MLNIKIKVNNVEVKFVAQAFRLRSSVPENDACNDSFLMMHAMTLF